jgi:arylformamidase
MRDISFGSAADQTLDIFPCERSEAPILLFAHGGAWKAGHKDALAHCRVRR